MSSGFLDKIFPQMAEGQGMPLRVRIFQLVCASVAFLSVALVAPMNLVQELHLAVHLSNLALGLAGAFFYWESRKGRHHIATFLCVALCLLDFIWFWNAGSQGSITYFYFPLLLLLMALFRGRSQWILAVALLLNVVLLLLLEHLFPGMVTQFRNDHDRFLDHVTGLIASLSVTAIVASVILLSYDREKQAISAMAAKLAESEKTYREIFNSTSDALMIYDGDARLVDFNERACALFGFDRSSGREFTLEERCLGHGLYTAEQARARIRLAMQGTPQVFEWKSRRGNGEIFWSEVAVRASVIAGHPRVIGAIRDITDRKRSEDELRTNEERLRLSMMASAQGWFEMNVQTGVGSASPEYIRIIEQDPAHFVTTLKDWSDNIHPDDRDRVLQAFRECVASGGTRTSEYRRFIRPGVWKWIRSVGKIVAFDAEGQPLRMCGTHADITERKELELRLLHSQRLEAVGRLASGVAHDLNNVLTPLLLVSSLFRDRLQVPEDRELLSMLDAGGRRGAAIVKQLLAFSQNLPENRVPVVPLKLVHEVVQLLRATLPGNISLVYPETDLPRSILADPTQLHQVLMNLCLNARDSMPGGGVLTLGIDWLELPPEATPELQDPTGGPFLVLTVTDTGAGIAPENLSRIFDPFYTTKEVGKGTGLGLATVYGIVKAHGGFVRVESTLGKGSSFKVHLPACTAAAGPSSPASDSESPASALSGLATETPSASGELILVVDDEEVVRAITGRYLEHAGYEVCCAAGGAEALVLLGNLGDRVKLVLTDFSMPAMDGPTLVPLLRKLSPSVPIIGVSGNDQSARAAELAALGFNEVLSKPYQTDDLLWAIQRQLRKART